MDGPEHLGTEGRGVGGAEGLILRLLTALNGRPIAMTSGEGQQFGNLDEASAIARVPR